MTAPVTWTGKGKADEKAITPEKLALLVDLLPSALSLRDLAAMLGVRLDAVRREAAPILAIMKLTGTHPKCGCGRDRFHPYGCTDSYAKGERADGMPGHTFVEAADLVRRRNLAIDMIKAGVRWVEIDEAFSLAKGSARKFLRFMTVEDREARILLDRARRDELRRKGARSSHAENKPQASAHAGAADRSNMRIAA